MDQETNDVSIIPSHLKKGWDVVRLGRWAGVFVLASALVFGAWDPFFFGGRGESLELRIFFFWRSFVGTGSFGVIIILLAELVNRLRDDEFDDASEANGGEVREDGT